MDADRFVTLSDDHGLGGRGGDLDTHITEGRYRRTTWDVCRGLLHG